MDIVYTIKVTIAFSCFLCFVTHFPNFRCYAFQKLLYCYIVTLWIDDSAIRSLTLTA